MTSTVNMINFMASFFIVGVVVVNGNEGEIMEPPSPSEVKISQFFLQFCTSVMECHSIFYYQHAKGTSPTGGLENHNINAIDGQSVAHHTQRSSPFNPNVVFVQPPDVKYKHNVQLNGGSEADVQTTVFVLPPKDEHSINITDNRTTENEVEKPRFFYLRNHPDDSDNETFPYPMHPRTSISKVQMRYTVTVV